MCSCSAIEVALQGAADLRARAMQDHALVALRDVERVAHLLRAAALDVAHRDDDALGRGRGVDRGDDALERPPLAERLARQSPPVAGVGPPVAREAIVGAAEAVRLDGGLLAL